jgi:hypothetical protein
MCRAAFGALEGPGRFTLYLPMERRPIGGERTSRRRVRRWAREIVIAALLTIAAAAFIATALLRGDGAGPRAPAFETARKPPTN